MYYILFYFCGFRISLESGLGLSRVSVQLDIENLIQMFGWVSIGLDRFVISSWTPVEFLTIEGWYLGSLEGREVK